MVRYGGSWPFDSHGKGRMWEGPLLACSVERCTCTAVVVIVVVLVVVVRGLGGGGGEVVIPFYCERKSSLHFPSV